MYIAQSQWTPKQARLGSTRHELKAVGMVLESFGQKLCNSRVRRSTDNQNIVHILQVDSRDFDLQCEEVKVLNLMLQYQIHIKPS